jgi:hypothetical protein
VVSLDGILNETHLFFLVKTHLFLEGDPMAGCAMVCLRCTRRGTHFEGLVWLWYRNGLRVSRAMGEKKKQKKHPESESLK